MLFLSDVEFVRVSVLEVDGRISLVMSVFVVVVRDRRF